MRPLSLSSSPARGRGFTVAELIVVILVVVLLVGILLPAMGGRRRGVSRQMRDSIQVRGVVQSLVVWASNNNGRYPMPSELDLEGRTVAEPGRAKDTTANILSLLIFNGNISPENLVSPLEANTAQVKLSTNYQYTRPAAALEPDKALWDPAFRGTPIDRPALAGVVAGVGNNSYAHAMPIGERLKKQWTDSYSSTDAVFGNRGPTYTADDSGASMAKWPLMPGATGTSSNTLLIHGGRTTWEGNIGYNDGRVVFETKPNPDGLSFRRLDGTLGSDNLFVNESDEAGGDRPGSFDAGLNMYLRPIADRLGAVNVWRD